MTAPPEVGEGTSADLVVVGSGAAGLTGALVAAIGGARVTVLEKTDLIGGTTAISGGGAWVPCNPVMAEVGLEDSREAALTYLRACTGEAGDEAMHEALVDTGPEMVRLLLDAGIPFQAWPAEGGAIDYRGWLPGGMRGGRTIEVLGFSVSELGEWADKLRKAPELRSAENMLEYYRQSMHLVRPGSETAGRMATPDPPEVDTYWRGTALVARLLKACLDRGVVVHVNTPARELIVEEGRVVGVRATHDGQTQDFRAPHVLMATGGYAHSEELKRLWLNRPLEYTCENEANEGDGHRMGAAVGAQLAGLGDAWWMPHTPMLGPDGVANAAGTREDRSVPHTMMVNPAGKRFMNESVNYYDAGESFGDKTGAAPRNWPAWLIFDSQGVERYAILAWKIPPAEYRPDFVHEGGTVEELAAVDRGRRHDAGAERGALQRVRPQRRGRGLPPRRERVGPGLGRSRARAQPLARHAGEGSVLRCAHVPRRHLDAWRAADRRHWAGALGAARRARPRTVRVRELLQRRGCRVLRRSGGDDRTGHDVRVSHRTTGRGGGGSVAQRAVMERIRHGELF